MIYFDFAKAFDNVDLGMLCNNMRSLGISGKLGEWLHDILQGKNQTVIANGALSEGHQSSVKSHRVLY